jgi:hypothetical protein
MTRGLFLLFTGCLSLYTTLLQAQNTAQQTPAYSLNQLAVRVADEPVPLQSDLARIALTELAAVYADEAKQARYEMRHRAKKPALRRWSVAVQKLADDYAALAESVTPSTPIQVSIGPEGSLYLQLDGKLVVVSSPRMNEQSAFEQRVVERFCNLNRCTDLLDATVLPVPAKTRITRAATLWSFSQNAGPTCISRDGLEFMFRNSDKLVQKREACARAVAELNILAAALAQETATGTRVDWGQLAVHAQVDGDEQVVFNDSGYHLRLPLPTLAPRRELLKRVRPWLAAKVEGTPVTFVILNAGPLLE